jgi:uncharacterized membrane protein YbhN (UPF0104 family)
LDQPDNRPIVPPSSRKGKQIFLVSLKLMVSAGLLYVVISRTGLDKVGTTLRGIAPFPFLIASLIYIFSAFLSTVRWRLLLPQGFEIKRLFSLYLIGSFFNNILPGIIGGDAVKAYYLYRDTGESGPAIASVFMDRYIGFSAMMVIGITAYPLGLGYFRGSYVEWLLPLIVLIFIVGSFLVLGVKIGKGIGILSELYTYFGAYRKQKGVLIRTFSLSLLIQLTGILAVYIISRGLRVDIPLLPLFIFIPIISSLASLPISISGLGVREASFVLLLGFLGISPIHATAISLAWFLSVTLGSLPGFVEYVRYRSREGVKHDSSQKHA